MKRSTFHSVLFLGIAIFTFLTPFHSAAAPLTPGEARGKRIYDKGTNTSGKPVRAYFGRGSELIELKGEGAACTSCHGYDGLGRPESGVIPTNVTWPYLIKSYGHIHPDGLEHPAFTEESLKSYMKDGIYPGGRKGDPAMPVYVIADEDLDDLIAYLKRLDTAIDPGLSDRSIRIGTIIPTEGAAGEIGEAMKRTIQAYFDEINDMGGIFSRKLELFAEKTALPVSQDALRKLIEQKQFFSLIATFTPGSDREISSVAETEAIPLIGPFTLFPVDVVALNRYVFYIHSGLREQMLALVEFAATNVATKNSRIVLLYPARADLIEVIEAVEAQTREKGWDLVFRVDYLPNRFDAGELIKKMSNEKIDLVVFLGEESEARAFLREVRDTEWAPYILFPGALLGTAVLEIPSRIKDRVYLAYPTLPQDRQEGGIAELEALRKKKNLPVTNVAAQISAFAAVKVLTEGLRRSGRDLSREKFIASLDGLFEFDTGLTRPLTYSKNRRIGALGAYIVTVDPDRQGEDGFLSLKRWIPLP